MTAPLAAGCVEPAPLETARPAGAENVPTPSPAPERPAAGPAGTVTLVAVGDIMMGTDFPQNFLHPALQPGSSADAVLEPGLLDLLRGADIAFGNFEGTLFDGSGAHKTCGNPANCYVFRSPEFYAEILADAGFDAVSLANNHSGDFLDAGRAATRHALTRAGIAYAGHDSPGHRTATVVVDDGLRVGIAAFAPNPGTLPINDIPAAATLVTELAADHDIVLVSFHGGAEGSGAFRVPRRTEIFLGENRGDVFAFSRAMIDAGADVVIGHGPHVPRAVEVYRDRFIAYSLGNFWTYARMNIRGLGGLGPVAALVLAPDGRLLAAQIHSTRQRDRGIPFLDPTNESAAVIARLTAEDFPEITVTIAPDGRVTAPGLED
ncbi:MAG: CapA family protein [Alphaproteobacteria bacterium]|jgi:hypothetical protein|nr:CapA family protein [Alphaproteobacteria bacterium]